MLLFPHTFVSSWLQEWQKGWSSCHPNLSERVSSTRGKLRLFFIIPVSHWQLSKTANISVCQILLWFIVYTQLSASCLLSASCWQTPARHTSDASALQHFLCWSIFSVLRRPRNRIPSCVTAGCVRVGPGDRNPRQALTTGQHPSSHLENQVKTFWSTWERFIVAENRVELQAWHPAYRLLALSFHIW